MVQRWHRFRQQVLPVVCFIMCGILTLWLWERQARMGNVVGHIYAMRVDVTATGTGVLASKTPTPGEPNAEKPDWELLDPVKRGDVIARLDDRLLRAEMNTASAEMVRLRRDLEATQKDLEYGQAAAKFDQLVTKQQEYVRRLMSYEGLRLDCVDRRTLIEEDNLEQARLETLIGQMRAGHMALQKDGVSPYQYELTDLEQQQNVIGGRLAERQAALKVAEEQRDLAGKLVSKFSEAPIPPLVNELLTPLDQAITVQEARIDAFEAQIKSLVILAPISGRIAAIHSHPGQAVQTGAPVVTIASNRPGEYIVSYVRQAQRLHPTEGMKVQLRTRGPGSQSLESEVEYVGPQFEEVPPVHLSDPAIQEWGLPVRIRLPAELRARPGEEIDIVFPPRQQQAS